MPRSTDAAPRRWQAVPVRYSEFWDLVTVTLGRVEGRTLANELVISALGDRTAAAALEDGEDPKAVWWALCDVMDVPVDLRWGPDRPPRKGFPDR